MKNKKIEYASTQQTPVVLPELDQLLPPLGSEELSALEADILENGCYAPLIVDEAMHLIDGHNRYRICQKYDLPFRMLVFSFADLLEAKQWALNTQKGRRNLDKWELGKIALKLKPDLEAKAKDNQGRRSDLSVNSQESYKPVDTLQEMADSVGIGQQTMHRIAQMDAHAPQILKDALDNKEVSINRGWSIFRHLQEVPESEQNDVAANLMQLKQVDAEIDRQAEISKLFSKAYGLAVQLDPTVDSVRAWTKYAAMDPSCMKDMMKESYELAQKFQAIGNIIANEILPNDWRVISKQNA